MHTWWMRSSPTEAAHPSRRLSHHPHHTHSTPTILTHLQFETCQSLSPFWLVFMPLLTSRTALLNPPLTWLIPHFCIRIKPSPISPHLLITAVSTLPFSTTTSRSPPFCPAEQSRLSNDRPYSFLISMPVHLAQHLEQALNK